MPDTLARPTLLQRAVLWILHALMFYVVAVYPVLLMARFLPDDVVHYGFLRWIAVVLVLYWAASQLFFTERPADTRPGRQTLAVTAGILLVLGVFTPIVSFPFVGDVDFFRAGYGDGYILLAMAGLSVALAVTGRWKQVLVPGLGALAVVLWTFLSVQDTVSQARSGSPATLAGNPHEGLAASVMQAIEWKWGWLLLFAGSGLLVYSAARRDELADEAPPFAPIGMEDEPAATPFNAAGEEPASAPAEAATGEASAPVEAAAAAPADASAPAETAASGSAGEEGAGSAEATDGETAAPAGAVAETPTEPAATPESAAAEDPMTATAETPAEPATTPESAAAAEQKPATPAGDAAADDAPPAAQPAEAKASTPTPEAAAAEPVAEGSGAPPAPPSAAAESEAAANDPAAKTETAAGAEAPPAAASASKKD